MLKLVKISIDPVGCLELQRCWRGSISVPPPRKSPARPVVTELVPGPPDITVAAWEATPSIPSVGTTLLRKEGPAVMELKETRPNLILSGVSCQWSAYYCRILGLACEMAR